MHPQVLAKCVTALSHTAGVRKNLHSGISAKIISGVSVIANGNINGLILAGGAGSRMQGRDKGLINWMGRPLVAHVAERLSPQVNELYISCNRNAGEYAKFAESLIADKRENFQGPLAGIEASAAIIESGYLIVVACDTPKLPADLVDRLVTPLLEKKVSPAGVRSETLTASALSGPLLVTTME